MGAERAAGAVEGAGASSPAQTIVRNTARFDPTRTFAFLRAARAYWLGVYPHVARELRGWRERAAAIEDPVLRGQALAALAKRGNMEGAAAFATFVPRGMRARVVRATVAFQAAYNHLDVLSEQPGSDAERSRHMHQALLDALDDARPGAGVDGGYVAALVAACREALAGLPSWTVARPWAVRAAERVVAFQAREVQEPAGDLRWWEATAATGSSLGVHAAIALAATPGVTEADARAIHDAYFPWIAALHSMLDHLVDAAEDRRDGQRNLIERYASREEAAERMALLAERALAAARVLSPAHRHELVVAAMASFYLADPGARTPETAPVAEAVLGRFGALVRGPLAVFRGRAAVGRLTHAFSDSSRSSPQLGESRRGEVAVSRQQRACLLMSRRAGW